MSLLRSPTTILVTGASQGLGRALAIGLAEQGHTVIAIARNADLLATLDHPNIHTFCIDLEDLQQTRQFAQQLPVQYPQLSGLIHNAAIQHEFLVTSHDYHAAQIAQEITINLTAPILLTKMLPPHLMTQPKAFICNITSILALAAKRKSAVYCATKAGLHQFSNSLRAQLKHSSVSVIEVLPPTIETQMTAHRKTPKMSADAVAEHTINAIAHAKQRSYPGKAMLFFILLRLFPSLAQRIMLKF